MKKIMFNDRYGLTQAVIDKVSGRGTWKSNPWVVAYEFDLLK